MVIFVRNDFKPNHINNLEVLNLSIGSHYTSPSLFTKYFRKDRDLLYFQGITEVNGETGDIFVNGSKINEFYTKILELVTPNTKKIIIDNSSEAPHIEYIKKVNIFFNSNGLDSCYLQSGFDNFDINDRILYYPLFLKDRTTQFIPLKDRTNIFNSLNRLVLGREHRLLVTYLIYKNDLLGRGVVSCGSGENNQNLEQALKRIKHSAEEIADLGDFIDMLPLIVDDKTDVVSTNTSGFINNPGFDSIINLVTESSFDRYVSEIIYGISYRQGWERHFFTEKTAKFINCNQIPLFIAPTGYVSRLRSLGFDMFDDFVDHSYDFEEDPDSRILKVVAELVRIVDNIDNLINSEGMEMRFKRNRVHLKRLHDHRYLKYQQQLWKFITIDRPYERNLL